MKPEKIVRADKVQGVASARPENEKYTFGEANEDRDTTNAIIDYLPFPVASDISGALDHPDLVGKEIEMIIGGGAILQEDDQFTKEKEDSFITMINGNTLLPNKNYRVFPR